MNYSLLRDSERMMNGWRGLSSQSCCLAFAVMVLLMAFTPVRAADYDEAYHPPRPRAAAGNPVVILDPRCRIVPMPEPNLFLDTTRFRPTIICMSRGMVADSFAPFPPSYPYDR